MRLLSTDKNELMSVRALKVRDKNLIISGTIMGAMPIEAVLTPAELRKAFKLMSFGTVVHIVKMLFSRG